MNRAMPTPAVDPERSRVMRAVKARDTRPERMVRSLAHRMGFRFRLHRADLPGKPDIVFVALRRIVFVHGCFWHGHDCPRGSRVPRTNTAYWVAKIGRNSERDIENQARLVALGWKVAVVWECDLRDAPRLARTLRAFLAREAEDPCRRNAGSKPGRIASV